MALPIRAKTGKVCAEPEGEPEEEKPGKERRAFYARQSPVSRTVFFSPCFSTRFTCSSLVFLQVFQFLSAALSLSVGIQLYSVQRLLLLCLLFLSLPSSFFFLSFFLILFTGEKKEKEQQENNERRTSIEITTRRRRRRMM